MFASHATERAGWSGTAAPTPDAARLPFRWSLTPSSERSRPATSWTASPVRYSAEEAAEVGFVHAELLLDGVAGQADFVPDDRRTVREPALDEPGLDVVRVRDSEVVVVRRRVGG